MITINSFSLFKPNTATIVTIGTFDGVHLGHKKIIEQLTHEAKKHKVPAVVLTFYPHPRIVLQQDNSIKMIQSLEERAAKLAALGVDYLVVYPFTKEFSRMSAQHFAAEILAKGLHAQKVLIGYDHRFGRNRNANITDLKAFGNALHFEVEEIEAKAIDAIAVSSTKIRKALMAGAVKKANTYLGHNFSIQGKVGTGKKIGRDIGFPTANLSAVYPHKIIPKEGVYVIKTQRAQGTIYGMLNIGQNPTISAENEIEITNTASLTNPKIEAHFFEFSEDLYGQTIEVAFIDRLRAEEKFPSLAALKSQLALDKKNAQAVIAAL